MHAVVIHRRPACANSDRLSSWDYEARAGNADAFPRAHRSISPVQFQFLRRALILQNQATFRSICPEHGSFQADVMSGCATDPLQFRKLC